MVENNLTHAHTFGRYFHVLVFANIFQGFLQREDGGRNDTGLLIGAGGTHVGELLRFGDIDHNIVFFCVFADNLAGVNLFLGEDEESAAVLQLVDGVGIGGSGLEGDERAVGAAFDVAFPGLVLVEAVAMMASPAEAVSTLLRRPMMPREGMTNSMWVRPF